MRITPPPDDFGVQRLKSANTRLKQVRQADEVDPYPRIGSDQEHTADPILPPPPVDRRKGGERRRLERRQEKEPISLDTRTPHDPRTEIRRREDRAPSPEPGSGKAASPQHGIDIKV